jgi:hypothetical protein
MVDNESHIERHVDERTYDLICIVETKTKQKSSSLSGN